jgi:hypothetical protein
MRALKERTIRMKSKEASFAGSLDAGRRGGNERRGSKKSDAT